MVPVVGVDDFEALRPISGKVCNENSSDAIISYAHDRPHDDDLCETDAGDL